MYGIQAIFCLVVVVQNLAIRVVANEKYGDTNRGYDPCTPNIYSKDGRIDVGAMLFNCSANMPGADSIPSYYRWDANASAGDPGYYAPLNVSVGIALNSMVQVEDVTTQVKISFWYRNFWTDPRWFMPDLWEHLNPLCSLEGLGEF